MYQTIEKAQTENRFTRITEILTMNWKSATKDWPINTYMPIFEAKVNYHRTWDKHDFTASAMFRQESMTLTGANNSRYRQYIIGTAGYNFDNRYMVDIVANCFGSSVLGKNDKYRAYPPFLPLGYFRTRIS